jgi:hypothetical protein
LVFKTFRGTQKQQDDNQNGIRLILGALADNADYFSEMAEDTELYYDKENKKMRVVK